MSLKLIRKTASGDLQLDGIPVFIAGSVAAEADLPISEERIGAAYFVGNAAFCVWNGKSWTKNEWSSGTCNAVAIDSKTINRILQQTGFPEIT